jgi:pyridoxine/pyridoxamine 5'-phosphate oxidase
MTDLQDALDRSLRQASPFTRSLFGDHSWDAQRVEEFVNTARNITISTVSAAGGPHAAVVIAACLGGTIHFTVADASALGRNLDRDVRIAFTVCEVSHAVMGRGRAVLVARSLDDPDLVERLALVAAAGSFTPPGWDGLVYCIEIDRIFAN